MLQPNNWLVPRGVRLPRLCAVRLLRCGVVRVKVPGQMPMFWLAAPLDHRSARSLTQQPFAFY